jgi:signal transduction histidine kinase
MRIRSLLFQLTAVVLFPSLLAAALAVSKVRESEREAALKGLVESVRATALLVDGEVKQSIGALTALATSPHLQTGDFKAFYEQAQAVEDQPNVWTLLLDDSGTQKLNTAVPFGTPPPAPAALERVTKALATRRPVMSDLIVGPVTKKLLTTLYVPASPSPMGNFVVAQAFAVTQWDKEVKRPADRPDWIIAVIDSKGKFIWRSHLAQAYLGQTARPELVAAAAASHSGELRLQTVEGIDSYQAFTHSELTGWTIAVAAPVPSIEASMLPAATWLGVGAVLATSLGLIAASLLGRQLLSSFQVASNAALALGRGELPSTPQAPVDEFNTLNTALQNAAALLAQEKRAREGVEREREQLLQAERAEREAAQNDNLQKDQFLALLGHELRNPLAAISGAGDVLNRGAKDPETRQRFVSMIQRQTHHLSRIVNDLLDVSRMLTGKIVLDARPVDLADCVRQCVEALRITPRAADHVWQLNCEPVWIHADAVRVEQIINNLAVNARNFSPLGAAIRITVRCDPAHGVLEVSDAGPGVAPELQAIIFEPFKQGPPMRGRQSTGLGIGLSLVRQLVQLHGGDVSVHSSGMGDGSTFVARFPRIPAPISVDEHGSTQLTQTASRP